MFKKEAVHERKEFNKELYEKIFAITRKPKKILDLGCGLHPIHFPFNDINYLAADIDQEALKKVKKHFKKNNLKGKVLFLDLNNAEELKNLEEVDITFIFKVLDSFKRQTIKIILQNTNTKYFIISFPTRTISGARTTNPKRVWFEKLVKNYEKIRYFNEIFYVIKRNLIK